MNLFKSYGILKRYQDLRNSIAALQQRVMAEATQSDIHAAAKELQIFRRKQIVFGHESEMPVFADYLVYAYRLNGVSLVDRFSSMHGSQLTAQEQDLLGSMRAARFRLLNIQSKGTDALLNAQDLVESKPLSFSDLGLWKSAKPGLCLGSRVVETDEFRLLTGGAVPIDQALLQRDEVKHAVAAVTDHSANSRASNDMLARTLIRAAIRLEYTSLMRFE
jgi:hypothetical protein